MVSRAQDKKEALASRAILVGIAEDTRDLSACESGLDELSRLLETAGGECAFRVIQVKEAPDSRTYIGKGKVREVSSLAEEHDVSLVVFDEELSPSQIRNLEEELGSDERSVRVIDRTMLILDIFALHAGSGEGKLQVELAQLRYTAPRLTGKGTALSRLGGGSGTRGPGESQLERDRRHISSRIHALETQLSEMEKNRATMRAARDRSGVPRVAIVGYTNAGKSTLLNTLTNAGVLAENKLFATLDPTTRRLTLPSGEEVLLTDTVGLIRKLPHHLIKAFRSTLDEAAQADILLVLADASDRECDEEIAVTFSLLDELGASGKPTLLVYNKCDRAEASVRTEYREATEVVAISARTGEGLDELLAALARVVRAARRECTLLLPYSVQGKLNTLYEKGTVLSVDYEEGGVRVRAILDEKTANAFAAYAGDDT